MKRVNILFGLIGILIGLFVFITTRSFPADQIMNVGPGYFPRVLAAGLIIFCIILIIKNLLNKQDSEQQESVPFDLKDPGVRRSAVALAATVMYGIGMNYLGFIIMTVLFLMFMMYLMKLRKWIHMAVVSVAVSLTVYFVFSVLLNITLPLAFWA